MEKNKIHFSLQEIGLSDKEIALYLAALKSGESGMSNLARLAELKRTSAYVVFNSLEQKGLLVGFDTKTGKKFMAKEPHYLLSKLQKETVAIEDVLPDLMAMSNKTKQRPKITYYEGVEDYKRIVEECLHYPNTIIRHIGSLTEGYRTLGKDYDLKYFMPTRIKNNIKLKALYLSESKSLFVQDDDEKQLRQVRFLPEIVELKTLTLIYGHRVVISTSKDNLITVVIDSEEVAVDEKIKFDLLWEAFSNQVNK